MYAYCFNVTEFASMNGTNEHEYHNEMEFVFEVLLLGITGLLGLVGNITAIGMFVTMKKQLNFHRLMVMLLVFDTMLVFVNMLLFVTPYLSSRFKNQILAYIQPVAIPFAQISMTGSIYSTLAISIERYMIACKPFYMNSHKWSVKRYIIPIAVFFSSL